MGARTTLRAVNAELRRRGIDAELVRGEGYYYATGPAVEYAPEQGMYGCCYLQDMTVGQWADEVAAKVEESAAYCPTYMQDHTGNQA